MRREEAVKLVDVANREHSGAGSFSVLIVRALEALGLLRFDGLRFRAEGYAKGFSDGKAFAAEAGMVATLRAAGYMVMKRDEPNCVCRAGDGNAGCSSPDCVRR